MFLKVTVSELQAAASKLTSAVEDFAAATQATNAAADTVAAGWEGDARDRFVEEQAEAIKWYRQVAEAVNVYISEIKAAAAIYTTLDIEGVHIIN